MNCEYFLRLRRASLSAWNDVMQSTFGWSSQGYHYRPPSLLLARRLNGFLRLSLDYSIPKWSYWIRRSLLDNTVFTLRRSPPSEDPDEQRAIQGSSVIEPTPKKRLFVCTFRTWGAIQSSLKKGYEIIQSAHCIMFNSCGRYYSITSYRRFATEFWIVSIHNIPPCSTDSDWRLVPGCENFRQSLRNGRRCLAYLAGNSIAGN